MTTWYVDPLGSDSNAGTSAAISLVNAWANGGAQPSNAQINAAFAAQVGS